MTKKILLKGKRVDSYKRAVQRRNRKFRKMSDDEKRVAVARDVLSQLDAEKYVATPGMYCRVDIPFDDNERVAEADADMSVVIAQTSCEVCGIGALFASTIRMQNKIAFNAYGQASIHNYLGDIFTAPQLRSIESYFEFGAHGDYRIDARSPIFKEHDADLRLRMIMENIISNDGRFDPYTGDHSVWTP